MITIRVYAPNSGIRWPRFVCRWWMAPWVFVLFGLRGLRARWWPAKGRTVTLADMLTWHPPGRGVCSFCRGTGLDKSSRKGKLAVRFCPKMQAAFLAKASFRCVMTKKGLRWLAGFEPERLVRT